MDRTISKLHNGLQMDGKVMTVGAVSCTVYLADADGYVVMARGATVPTDAAAGFAKGAIFMKSGGGVATTIYLNEGTSSSCDFNAIESSASTVTGVTAGAGMTGGGTEGSVTLNVIGDEVTITVGADVVSVKTSSITSAYLADQLVSTPSLTITNKTGGTLTKGTLVYVSGFDTTSGNPSVTKADGDSVALATHVLNADILNDAVGLVYGMRIVTNIATDTAGSVGDPVYLDTTAGAYTFTPSGGTGVTRQRVGTVVTKHATTGSILFYPMLGIVEAIGSASLQNGAVTLAKLATGVTPSHVVKFAGTITWSGSGASLATAIAGLAATDIISVSTRVAPTQAASILSAIPTTDTLTITLSTANTSNDAQIDYVVYRAAA